MFQALGFALSIVIITATTVSLHHTSSSSYKSSVRHTTSQAFHEPTTAAISPELQRFNKGTGQTLAQSDVKADAWIYPDAAGALKTLQTAGNINALKIEFMHVEDDGSLSQITQSEDYPNGYSQSVVDVVKRCSKEQYFTVSGSTDGTRQLMQNPDTINQIVSFADKTGFNVELDWEGFSDWDGDYYQSYKSYIKTLAEKLHAHHHKLMIDGPPIAGASSQKWYLWKYEELAPLVDETVMMVYDNQYDTGAGNSIAPQEWSEQCMKWLREKTNGSGIAGIAAYGYEGRVGSYRVAINTSDGIIRRAGDVEFTRNQDGELTATKNGIFYDFSDQKTLEIRLDQVEKSGLKRMSVWSLGQNPWFK